MSVEFLNDLGFDVKDDDELLALLNDENCRGWVEEYPFNSMECAVVESGRGAQVRLYSEMGSHLINDSELCYVAGPTQLVKGVKWVDDDDDATAHALLCRLPADERDVLCSIQIVNSPDFMESPEGRDLELKIGAFPVDIEYYATAAAQYEKYHGHYPFGPETLAPSADRRTPEEESLAPVSVINSVIRSLKKEVNEYSQKEYYVMELCCHDICFAAAADAGWFNEEPREGGFVVGLFYLTALAVNVEQGKIMDGGVQMALSLPAAPGHVKRVEERAERVLWDDTYCIIDLKTELVDAEYHKVNFIQFARETEDPPALVVEIQFADPHMIFPPEGRRGEPKEAAFRQFSAVLSPAEAVSVITALLRDCEIPDVDEWEDITPIILFPKDEAKEE